MKDELDIVTLDVGPHVLSSPFVINHGKVVIQGLDGAVIRIADGTDEADYGAFFSNGPDNVIISNLEIDGNKAGQGVYVNTPPLISVNNMIRFSVEDCHLYDSMGDGIEPVTCEDVWIIDSHIHDCDQHAIHLNGVTDGLVVNCILTDDGSNLITMGHGGINGILIRNNTLERPGGVAPAIGVSSDDAPATMRQDCTILNNVIVLGVGQKAIAIAEDFDNCCVSCNEFSGGAAIIVTIGAGATNVVISGNPGLSAAQIECLGATPCYQEPTDIRTANDPIPTHYGPQGAPVSQMKCDGEW